MLLLSINYIAYALGSLGILTCIRMKTPCSYSTPPVGDVVIPYPKVPRRNLGYHVCCSHTTATRSALSILVVRKRPATQIVLSAFLLPLQSLTHMGNRVILTCIMSTIPLEHGHSVFTRRCIASTLKNFAP
jgi:hypothetical protein